MKNPLVSGMGLATSIIQALVKHAEAKGVTPEMVHWLSTQKKEADAVVEVMAEKMAGVLFAAQNRIGRVFSITRGGNRTTEQIVGATIHTFVNSNITSANFPLTEAPEEECELVVFQVPEYDHEPSSGEILAELKKRCLERPTYEDALKFDEAHPDEKGIFVFLHEPWKDPDCDPRVIVVRRGDAHRNLYLPWFARPWLRGDWFVGVCPRK